MNNTKRLSIAMTKSETVWGWLYTPFYFVLLAGILSAVFRRLGWETDSPGGQARLNGLFFLVNFLACVLIYRKFLCRSLVLVGRRFWGFVQAVILGLVMYYAGSLLLSWALNLLAPDRQNVNDAAIAAMAREARLIMVVGTVLLAPLAEECIFRGLVFQGLFRRSRIAAYGLSTLTFCLVHVAGYVTAYPPLTLVLCALEYVPAGIALAWAYERADTIFAPILMHCLINAMSLGMIL